MTDGYRSCDNCYYEHFNPCAFPCSMCIRGYERSDMWKGNREAEEDEE